MIWFAALALSSPAQEAPGKCEITHSATSIERFADLPETIRTDLIARTGPVADLGEPFNPSDVIGDDVPQRRFLYAWRREALWVVSYEHGGRGYHFHTVGYRVDSAGRARIDVGATFSGNPCAATQALLGGARNDEEHDLARED